MPYRDPEYKKKYYLKNREKYKQYHKEYRQTETGKEKNRINAWKHLNPPVKCDNYKALYKTFINTTHCENCNVELVEGRYGANRRCLDHCHITGEFRNVLCHACNLRRR
jgi:hypothetical protein